MAGQTRGIVIGGHLPAEVQAAGGGQPLSRQRQKRNVAAGRQGLAVVIPDRIRQAMRQRRRLRKVGKKSKNTALHK